MHALSLPLQTANFAASIIITKSSKSSANYPNNYSSSPTRNRIVHSNDNSSSVSCRASSSSSSSSSSTTTTYGIKDFDLYDLLGIDSSSDHSKIKAAYRSLQKRCHPDIAGPPGHDMAIILNEAYALLSDPSSRLAYDKEQAKMAELRGYTAKPMYSVWLGSESEERAVFVDEVKCIGCLKCALFAEKTFAVESVYGRARVVAQWADPEYKIQEAIDACPVDCILTVERSDLPALEFLMSKQPRGNVRVGTSNTVGARVSNVFEDVKKFKKRHQDAMENSSKQNSKETDIQIEARLSAIQAIRSISKWLYWKTPNVGGSTSNSHQKLLQTPRKTNEPNIEKLQAAAAARKQARESSKPLHQTTPNNYIHDEDYWMPLTLAPPVSKLKKSYSTYVTKPSTSKKIKEIKDKDYTVNQDNERNPVKWGFPVGPAIVAAVLVRIQLGEEAVGGLEHHMGGSLALQIVNSSWVPVIIAGITWYTIGMMTIGFVQAIRKK